MPLIVGHDNDAILPAPTLLNRSDQIGAVPVAIQQSAHIFRVLVVSRLDDRDLWKHPIFQVVEERALFPDMLLRAGRCARSSAIPEPASAPPAREIS
jgi:hypothetical protein